MRRWAALPSASALAFGCGVAAICVAALLGTRMAAAETLSLDLPVACDMESVCSVQFYVDHGMGPGAIDYACGSLTYDGHRGTDIRLPDLVTMARGIPVIAAADGVVRAIRDGEPDLSVDRRSRAAVGGRQAGNAVVLVHDGGWETQYSHLKEGSVVVRPGQAVKAGDRLGLIGLSGETNFPHLEFGVRHKGTPIDPFTGEAPQAACGDAGIPLWSAPAQAALRYRPGGLLLAGFAAEVPDKARVRAGAHRASSFGRDSTALVFWTDVYGVQAGDRALFRLYGPADELVAQHERIIETDGHQLFDYAGRRRPEEGWSAGTYRGEYELRRTIDGVDRIIVQVVKRATLR